MNLNLTRKVVEASYLTAQNYSQYRYIIRFFYEQHKKLRYLLSPEEIITVMQGNPFFANYTKDELQRDLNALVEWNNLIARQDVKKANSIEEFKQKRYLYQCTPYTIEIERMLEKLEGMTGHGGSLEPKFFDKLVNNLIQIEKDWDGVANDDVYIWWDDLINSFQQLSENASDYLAHLQTPKVESLMMARSFLAFKDQVTEHLRDFMKALQRSFYRVESILHKVGDTKIRLILNKVCEHELSIPRLDEERDFETLWDQRHGQWLSLRTWFLGNEERQSDLEFLQNTTNDTIRRITRFAIRLSENSHGIKSRKQEYLTLARMFAEQDSVEEAHGLSAVTFGVMHTQHMYTEVPKSTERIDLSLWEEEAVDLIVNPRIRAYRPRTRSNPMVNNQREKAKLRAEYLQQKEQERVVIDRYIQGDGFQIADLPEVNPLVRRTILQMIDRATGSLVHQGKKEAGSQLNKRGKTEGGREYTIQVPEPMEWVILCCTDGSLKMPNYRFIFHGEVGGAGE